jgi:hypothetical protein
VPVWPSSSRAGPRAGPSPLRSTSARRRRRGASPRRAPSSYAPLARGPGSCLLSAGARRRRRRPSPLRAGSHSLILFTGPWARVGLSASPTSPLYCAAAAARSNLRWGTGGGRVQPSRGFAMRTRRRGERRGNVSSSLARPLGYPIDPPRARGAAAGVLRRPKSRAAPRRSAVGPVGPGRVLLFSFSHLHCAARVWSRWARRAGSPQPTLGGREGDVSYPPCLCQAGPSPWGAEGGRVPPSRLPAVRWWCGSTSP